MPYAEELRPCTLLARILYYKQPSSWLLALHNPGQTCKHRFQQWSLKWVAFQKQQNPTQGLVWQTQCFISDLPLLPAIFDPWLFLTTPGAHHCNLFSCISILVVRQQICTIKMSIHYVSFKSLQCCSLILFSPDWFQIAIGNGCSEFCI